MRFTPAQPLPGGIDSFIIVQAGPAQAFARQGTTPEGHELLGELEARFHADDVVEGSGSWHGGQSAVWFRGRVSGTGLTRSHDPVGVDGFVLIAPPLGSEARVILVAAYPEGIYERAFTDVIGGLTPEESSPTTPGHGRCAGTFSPVRPAPFQRVAAITVRFNTTPTVDVTSTVTCKPASPGKTGCYFLDAIFQVASVGDRTYTLGIWPTATDAQVQQLRSILQRSPYVSNFWMKDR